MAYINSKSQWSYRLYVKYSKIGLIYVDSIGIVLRITHIYIPIYIQENSFDMFLYSNVDR